MKIPTMFCNRDTVALLLAYQSAFKHLRKGFKELFICTIFVIPCIFLTVLDAVIGKLKR